MISDLISNYWTELIFGAAVLVYVAYTYTESRSNRFESQIIDSMLEFSRTLKTGDSIETAVVKLSKSSILNSFQACIIMISNSFKIKKSTKSNYNPTPMCRTVR